MKLILASNSPRRKELLAGLGIPYDVFVLQDIDESYPDTLPANEVAEYIARKKAEAYKGLRVQEVQGVQEVQKVQKVQEVLALRGCSGERSSEQDVQGVQEGQGGQDNVQCSMFNVQCSAVLLTADTVVVCDGEILGKPRDADDACAMLRKLSGKTHQVYTGYCLLKGDKTVSGTVCSDVTFKELSDEEITHYVTTYKPFDKAGAYGIQEWIGYIGITGIRGSYYNVMGLPVQRIYEELRKI